MAAWVVLLLWTLMSVLTGMGLGSWITRTRLTAGGSTKSNSQDFTKLVKEVTTEQNKHRVEQLIKYHNSRVAAGADTQASYNRLVKDLMRLKKEIQDENGITE